MDVAIVGAGACGLWLANVLSGRGLSVALWDPNPVGGEQTIASQGIVHGGIKYALDGRPRRASETLAGMPERWRRCLAGGGEVDLRGVPVLADTVHLFSPTLGGQARALLGSRLLAGRLRRVDAAAVAPFRRGLLLELDDFVIDVPALVRRLAEPLRGRLIRAAPTLVPGAGGVERLDAPGGGARAQIYLLAAGAGNEALARRAGFADVAMRRRPLRQTIVQPETPMRLFAHCLASGIGVEPELTVTSHGRNLYVGGKVAGDGAARSPAEQAAAVRRTLARFFPAIDWAGARFATHLAARAEPARRPADGFAERRGNCVLCWPVKLSLMPALSDRVATLLQDVRPAAAPWHGAAGGAVEYAAPPHQRLAAAC